MVNMLNSKAVSSAVIAGLSLIASPVAAGPVADGMHTPDGTPTVFCSSKFVQFFDAGLILPAPDLIDDGCISGIAPGYNAPGTSQDGNDGFYSNTGGGDPEAAVELQIALAIGEFVELTLAADINNGAGSSNGITSSVSNGGKTISWAVTDETMQLAYVTIKAANSYLLYKIPTGAFGGQFTTQGLLTNGGQQPGVSHIRFWYADRDIPEPAAIGLFGLGLLGLGAARRTRR